MHKRYLSLPGMEVKEHIKIRKPVNFVAVYLTRRICVGFEFGNFQTIPKSFSCAFRGATQENFHVALAYRFSISEFCFFFGTVTRGSYKNIIRIIH